MLSGQFIPIVKGQFDLFLAVERGPDLDIEGRGVSPDVIVPAPVPYANGADPQLERALSLLEKW